MFIKKRKLKIALFGPCPPPYGGVSIHVQRLSNLLFENHIDHTIYDITQFKGKEEKNDDSQVKNWLKIIFFSRGIIHIHNSGLNLLKIFLLSILMIIKGNKVIITFHSLRDEIEKFSWCRKKVLSVSIANISYFIVTNSRIKEKLVNVGVINEKITVIPGFLPPNISKKDTKDIPAEIWEFIKNHHPIISANAFRIEFYNNQDLYGLDMCIELCTNLKKKYPHIGFVFCLPSIGDYDYFSEMKNKITSNNIEKNFMFITQPFQFYPILRASDLFVRPTNTDGDAVSIRESLYFKIPSVVSDIVPRPKGTNVFHNRDITDFTLKVENIFENYENHKKNLENLEIENNFNKIMSIYKKVHN
jgi:glycosyltransferase involved in cell wall biosynthesis